MNLTDRERKIVGLMFRGFENREIGKECNLAERTVKQSFHNMFVKFGIGGRVKRVKLAIRLYQEPRGVLRFPDEVTKKERELLGYVASGLANREIASKLGITAHVVKNRLRAIYDKTGMSNRVELMMWYYSRTSGNKNGQKKQEVKNGLGIEESDRVYGCTEKRSIGGRNTVEAERTVYSH